MRLGGLQKLTLLDFPGEIACTVFTEGCNLRCPFCQNPALVLPELYFGEGGESLPADESNVKEQDGVFLKGAVPSGGGAFPEEEFFDFLEKRRGRLTGVAVSGGEPTIQADLPEFLEKIRSLGFLVKLDTNGLKPEVLRGVLRDGLVDYVAMDVKNSPGKYALTCGWGTGNMDAGTGAALGEAAGASAAAVKPDRAGELWEHARESISILMEGRVTYEFRTTVVLGLHTAEDIREMSRQLAGARAWYLQQFVASESLVGSFRNESLTLASPSRSDLEKMRAAAAGWVPSVSLRGVDT